MSADSTRVRFPSCAPREISMTDLPIIDNKCPSNFDCGKAATEDHTCPYAEDINNDSESLCNCCDDCANECAMDI
jgi:hypothetical protein